MIHRWNIDESIIHERMMSHRWRNRYVLVFYSWIHSNKITNSSFQIIIHNHSEKTYLSKTLFKNKKKKYFELWARNFCLLFSKLIFVSTEEHFRAKVFFYPWFFSDIGEKFWLAFSKLTSTCLEELLGQYFFLEILYFLEIRSEKFVWCPQNEHLRVQQIFWTKKTILKNYYSIIVFEFEQNLLAGVDFYFPFRKSVFLLFWRPLYSCGLLCKFRK